MIRDLIASIVFTVAALALINFIGDLALNPAHMQTEMHVSEDAEPEAEATPETVAEPEAAPVAEPEAAPEPEPVATEPAAAPAMATVGDAEMATVGDADKGQKLFRGKCMACHTIAKGDKNRTGPNLWAIVGRDRANAENFNYSNTMKMLGGVWSEADIDSFIAGPRSFLPDTKMTFAGLKNAEDRADVIAFLKLQTD